MIKIKKNVLETIIIACRNVHPREFFALLGGTSNSIDEVVVAPAVYGKGHTLVKAGLLPIDFKIVGSVHSHPSPSNRPSTADLHSFSAFGRVHLIIAWPYNINTAAMYDVSGKNLNWEVIK